jgi:hypothetical protein
MDGYLNKGLSALELKRKLDLKSYQTAWTLVHKIRQAMKSSEFFSINRDVELDDTLLGLVENSASGWALAAIVVEPPAKRIGWAYLEPCLTQTSEDIEKFMDRRVTPGMKVKTVGHVSNKFLKDKYQHQPLKMYDKQDMKSAC